jgi:hypothetical protein
VFALIHFLDSEDKFDHVKYAFNLPRSGLVWVKHAYHGWVAARYEDKVGRRWPNLPSFCFNYQILLKTVVRASYIRLD